MFTFLIAATIGVAIFSVAVWVVRALANPPPSEPDPGEVMDVSVDYWCKACGLALTVTQAHDEKPTPPRHCREEMVRG